jgi:hypothetical protein
MVRFQATFTTLPFGAACQQYVAISEVNSTPVSKGQNEGLEMGKGN